MAAQTPAERNRYVDFLRFISILVVIVGHWLIATAYMVDGEMHLGHLLKDSTQFHWMTWLFQVMPIFFIVGGYSNAVSLESAKRKGIDYAGWLSARLNRLVAPLLVLLISWGIIAVLLAFSGVTPENVKMLSRAALIPTWFLAIYIMIVMLAPAAYKFWRRFGFASFWAFVVAAVLTDVVFFKADIESGVRWIGFANYFFVWLAVHHLGFAWRDGRMVGAAKLLFYAAVGFVSLWLLTTYGPYPLAMVGSPDVVSNSAPPKVTLIALGVFQFGLLLSLENPMRRALNGLRLWTATVLINSMIMTVYLWHMTLMIVFVSLLYLAGGPGLGIEPATTEWWLTRPVWIGVLLILLLPVALLLSPLERRSRSADVAVPAAAQQIAGAVMLCFGITMLVMIGYDGTPTTRLDLLAIAMVVVGAGISGLLPKLR